MAIDDYLAAIAPRQAFDGETMPPRPALTVSELRRRRRHLPAMDPNALRRDVDAVLDTSL